MKTNVAKKTSFGNAWTMVMGQDHVRVYCNASKITVRDAKSGLPVETIPSPKWAQGSLSPDGRCFVTTSELTGCIHVYHAGTPHTLHFQDRIKTNMGLHIAFSPCLPILYVAGGHEIYSFNLLDGKKTLLKELNPGVFITDFSCCGDELLCVVRGRGYDMDHLLYWKNNSLDCSRISLNEKCPDFFKAMLIAPGKILIFDLRVSVYEACISDNCMLTNPNVLFKGGAFSYLTYSNNRKYISISQTVQIDEKTEYDTFVFQVTPFKEKARHRYPDVCFVTVSDSGDAVLVPSRSSYVVEASEYFN